MLDLVRWQQVNDTLLMLEQFIHIIKEQNKLSEEDKQYLDEKFLMLETSLRSSLR